MRFCSGCGSKSSHILIMANPEKRDTGPETTPQQEGTFAAAPSLLPAIAAGQADIHTSAAGALAEKQRKLGELARRRESKEISPYDLDLNVLWRLNGGDDEHVEPTPLTRSMLMHSTGEHAVVLSPENRKIVRRLTFIDCYGRTISVDLRNDVPEDETLILFPEDLGDTEGKPSLRVID
ncbi:MAG: hypothetical protein PHX93_04680 [Candidatus Peribacteraceae bacterium]|nr:hypothetical protein [Candidatus Peribacteraceae bacterium]